MLLQGSTSQKMSPKINTQWEDISNLQATFFVVALLAASAGIANRKSRIEWQMQCKDCKSNIANQGLPLIASPNLQILIRVA
jgi:hypothetical protein